jgi:hypothetical protein
LLAQGHPAPLYAAAFSAQLAEVIVSHATYNCAERAIGWLIRKEKKQPWRWRRLALWNAGARMLESEGR